MNRISRYNKVIIVVTITVIIVNIITMILTKEKTLYSIYFLLMMLLCIYTIINTFKITDIEISDGFLVLRILSSQKMINLDGLKIHNITIRIHPLFFMETSVGNFNVNYTNNNYQQILKLLEITKFKKTALFKKKVGNYIIQLFDT